MLIDFSKKLLDLSGKPCIDVDLDSRGQPAKDPKSGEIIVVDATLGRAAVNALLAQFPDERELAGPEKVKRFTLAMKLQNGKKIDVSVEEAALIKSLVAKAFPPLIVGRCWEILDPVK